MNRYTGGPQYALVFDVNVLIDAVSPTSKHHDAAVRALSSSNGQPVYFSDHMLSTTSHELIRLGADSQVVEEYLEFVTVPEEEFGPQAHTFRHIDFRDYDVLDRHGNPDKEDATIVSLMDAAEDHARLPALLVSTDGGIQEWCAAHRRAVTFPNSLPRTIGQHEDEFQSSNFEYVSRQMFPNGVRSSKLPSTPELRGQAKQVVRDVRTERDSRQREVASTLFDDPTAVSGALQQGAAAATRSSSKSPAVHDWSPTSFDPSDTTAEGENQPGS